MTDLPRGTLTFLFTDTEGTSLRWSEQSGPQSGAERWSGTAS